MPSSVLTVILNYRTAPMTLRAAEAAVAAMQGVDGAVTVVDNDSQDGSEAALRAGVAARGLTGVRVIQAGRNGGFGAGNNVGIAAGLPDGRRPDHVYLLNSDAFPAPDAIRILRDYLDANPAVGFAGSHVHGLEGDPHLTAFRFPNVWSELEGAARTGPVSRLLRRHVITLDLPDQPCAVDWVAGASVMIRREVLDAVGLFDEGFFLYFEETDLCRRAAAAGWPVHYVPAARVAHVGSESTGAKRWQRTPGYWFDSRWRYFAKHHGRGYAAAATLAHLTGAAIWRLRRLVERQPPGGPDRFMRDLAAHALRNLARPNL
ncbi:MAG: glycosyltransferase family 2 protein [Gemmobacter sp.]